MVSAVFPRAKSLIMGASRYNDLFLAFLVVAIISLMVLPLPTVLVDGLIATNLGIAVSLLMLSLYIPSALSLSTFPTLLLFTTLFRLALNITTTRQILLYAYAGDIIDTFGNLVVGGNFVVGAVIFLIITIVQFLVIAKGAERVAEVGARFTLDAMPGKQMSIDADLRAGSIQLEEAQGRRSSLERESQLYGAMDGAMKFVKGDAIAGLIVTAVNILAGIAIGVWQKDMGATEALQTFAVLTIGDGLISQIPALFISITAGVIVTRVAADDSGHLGGDIGTQVLAQPKALAIGGAILLAFTLIPGFPKFPFLVLGGMVTAVGITLWRQECYPEETDQAIPGMEDDNQDGPAGDQQGDKLSFSLPLMVELDSGMKGSVDARALNETLMQVRRALYMDLGVPFPGIHLRFSKRLPSGQYRIAIKEIPVSEGFLRPGHVLVNDQPENLEMLDIPFEQGEPFLPDLPALWVSDAARDLLAEAEIQVYDHARILAYHLSKVLHDQASDFIGLQETQNLLDKMEEDYDVLVKEIQRVIPTTRVADVFQRLVAEGLSIRDLPTIMEGLIEWGQKESDIILLTEYVRMGMSRYISHQYAGPQNLLAAYMLDPDLEETIRAAVRQTSGGSYLSLDPKTSKEVVTEVRHVVGDLSLRQQRPVLLTSMDIRRFVRKLIEDELPTLPVLSYQELTPKVSVQPLGQIQL
ncbi:type III secretion system export apparatus subunit SctV [Acanthopleuribacter pedis]|uniref:Type III secretion system export apparatus subunit SctV n=1 Tax=Acanthopleuribacter pedis TaxID=442870 RepID=A0A8J7U889_9BACT|nr:type III secretion system export apparatus subunit SctV [Acanthopleuribacter pedis]MBO1323323.1 type III secretion system export apparatus subunit SctV [Acanthopleuribacter pedis]